MHYTIINQNILSKIRLVVLKNDPKRVVNVVSLGRSIHYIIINQSILERVTVIA